MCLVWANLGTSTQIFWHYLRRRIENNKNVSELLNSAPPSLLDDLLSNCSAG